MSSTTPSATRNSASLDRLQVEKGRLWSCGSGQGDLLDLLALGQRELGWSATGVLRGQGVEPVGVEVVDHFTYPVLRGEGDGGDLGHVHSLGRPQHHLGSSSSHHRSGPASDDREEFVPLDVGDLPDTHSFGHVPCCATSGLEWWTRPGNVAGHGTSTVGSRPRAGPRVRVTPRPRHRRAGEPPAG
jgi:hypothetical protein